MELSAYQNFPFILKFREYYLLEMDSLFGRNNVLRYASQNSQPTQDRSTRVLECLRCQSSIMLDQRDKLRLTSGITYAEIGPNSPRKILLPRVETKITTRTNQYWQA